MSKNFELMQLGEIKPAVLGIGEPRPDPAATNSPKNGKGKGVRFNLEDELIREESLKLMQNIFLMRGTDCKVGYTAMNSSAERTTEGLHMSKSIIFLLGVVMYVMFSPAASMAQRESCAWKSMGMFFASSNPLQPEAAVLPF
jgi:hypothetical protein